MIKKVKNFTNEVQMEMKKVSWPNWDELKGATYVVLSLALLVAGFLFIIDLVLNKLMNFIL
ncbi:MAG: preprotein translocase subunit SecE [Candidatus Marinimicrobia bacterium]|jgi:preprotein translocase subunit SecE|nr:preprotein translocase subunit SecE [Candidatus Neomarinimicrobiota bacterium]